MGLFQIQAARLDATNGLRPCQQMAGEGPVGGDEDITNRASDHILRQAAQQGLRGADGLDDAKIAVDLDQKISRRQ